MVTMKGYVSLQLEFRCKKHRPYVPERILFFHLRGLEGN